MKKSKRQNETDEEVYEWIAEIQANPSNEALKEKIVLQYEGLVHSMARKYSNNRRNHEDLAQVGMIGLLMAVERFDRSYKKTFEAFAIPTIIGEIKRHIRDKTWSVHVPRRIKELGPKINRAVETLTNELQRSPTVSDIATYLEVSEEEVLETMEMSQSYRALSVDYQHDSDGEGNPATILDVVGTEEEYYEKLDLHMMLESVFHVLEEREQHILKLIFFENLSQKEVGELLDISQMHVSRLQRRALKTLREALLKQEDDMIPLD